MPNTIAFYFELATGLATMIAVSVVTGLATGASAATDPSSSEPVWLVSPSRVSFLQSASGASHGRQSPESSLAQSRQIGEDMRV
jgi:hypothetical protein